MAANEIETIENRVAEIRRLGTESSGIPNIFHGAMLAQTVLHDTVGGSHPLMAGLKEAIDSHNTAMAIAGTRGVITLYEQGSLTSPRLVIAHEIESSILDTAQTQVQAAETNPVANAKQLQLAVAAFLAGAALEDALRRICIAQGIAFEVNHTSIAILQGALYQPSKNIEIISSSENKQITAWGDTRNKADHGKFGDLTHTEVLTMVMGIRAFLDKHLP